jgi:hypothetical protein
MGLGGTAVIAVFASEQGRSACLEMGNPSAATQSRLQTVPLGGVKMLISCREGVAQAWSNTSSARGG